MAEIRDWIRGLDRDGVTVLLVSSDEARNPVAARQGAISLGVLEALDAYNSGALMPVPRAPLTLDSFLNAVRLVVARIGENHQAVQFYIPRDVSPQSPLMEVPKTFRALDGYTWDCDRWSLIGADLTAFSAPSLTVLSKFIDGKGGGGGATMRRGLSSRT